LSAGACRFLNFSPRFLRLRLSQRPIDDMVLIFGLRQRAFARADFSAHGNAGGVHGLGRARHERVPPSEPAPFGEAAIGAGVRQPAIIGGALRRELEAIAHALHAVGIVGAAAGVAIEQPAGDVGVKDFSIVYVFELQQTATRAAVAQRFPLRASHFGEWFSNVERLNQDFLF